MRKQILLSIMATGLYAQNRAMPDVDLDIISLRAQVAALTAQLAQMRLEYQYAQQVCSSPDMMRLRLATIDATQKAEEAKRKPAEPVKK